MCHMRNDMAYAFWNLDSLDSSTPLMFSHLHLTLASNSSFLQPRVSRISRKEDSSKYAPLQWAICPFQDLVKKDSTR